jgi:hypothetical protein
LGVESGNENEKLELELLARDELEDDTEAEIDELTLKDWDEAEDNTEREDELFPD